MASRLRGSSFPPGLLGLGETSSPTSAEYEVPHAQRARSHSNTMCALAPAAASRYRHPGRQHRGDNNRDQRGDDQPGAYNAVHPHVVTRDLSGGRCNTVRSRTRVRFRTAGRAGVCVRRRETPAPDETQQSSQTRSSLSHPWERGSLIAHPPHHQKPGLGSGLRDRFARQTAAHRLVSPLAAAPCERPVRRYVRVPRILVADEQRPRSGSAVGWRTPVA
jgi:hypothetical protein